MDDASKLNSHPSGVEHGPPSKKPRLKSEGTKSTTRACAECRRRRIRCDGTNPPCGACRWYMVSELCHYPSRKPRTTRTLQDVSENLEKASHILQELFPAVPLERLSTMKREELLQLIKAPESLTTIASANGVQDEDIQCLEPSPQEGFEWDESRRNQEVADDVNGLSLAIDSSSSYLGISSINAVLRVISSISPGFPSWIQRKSAEEQPASLSITARGGGVPPDEKSLIEAYFSQIHCITPIVNEEDFRARYARANNNDAPWQALLNMVLTTGCIASSTPDEKSHAIFFARAQNHLGLESFGSGHLETVQALGILGGYYCHYLNQPNMANVIMGSALRMAIAMGLHRETASSAQEEPRHQVWREARRRVWWSLFCLDTWASMLLGRPVLGRWDPETITAKLPSALSSSDNAGLSLRSSVQFCKIGTALQDRFARLPLMSYEEIETIELQVKGWLESLPLILKISDSAPPQLLLAQVIIYMRAMNMRLVLHRPRLLTSSLRRARGGPAPSEEEVLVVEKCRALASKIITGIKIDWFRSQLWVRNLNWILFQACMVLLLSLFSEPGHKDYAIWESDIEVSLELLEKMSEWGLTVRRTREVVSMIFEASKAAIPRLNSEIEVGQDFGLDSSSLDSYWDPASWGALPGFMFNDLNFDMTEFGALSNDYTEFNSFNNLDTD